MVGDGAGRQASSTSSPLRTVAVSAGRSAGRGRRTWRSTGSPGAAATSSAQTSPSSRSSVRRRSPARVGTKFSVATSPSSDRWTAPSRVAWCAAPMPWIGYQYWLKVLVSPGSRKVKSGWLSV
ncbi:hypothetical protein [Tessaracoccus coleopterorum]|uniref:hypothetical protein n=1 Tax=Tessaracoccus coleopterorum TaxID=2714950 RepID=UPI0018D28591|nr:hypothetical protein [Tessaracoccus coleopterorum]